MNWIKFGLKAGTAAFTLGAKLFSVFKRAEPLSKSEIERARSASEARRKEAEKAFDDVWKN